MPSLLLRALRWTASVVLAGVTTAAAKPQAPAYRALPRATVAEQFLLHSINVERAAMGLRPVFLRAELQEAAHGHAVEMAHANTLEHQLRGEPDLARRNFAAGARFMRITENIGVGPSIPEMHVALMHSPHHRENILDEQVTFVGIAVIQVRGSFWAVEDFSDDGY